MKKHLNLGMLRCPDKVLRSAYFVTLMRLPEQQSVDHSTPDRYSLAQCVRHAFTPSCGVDYDASVAPVNPTLQELAVTVARSHDSHEPTRSPCYVQYLQIQASGAKAPLSPMPIGALKVGTAGLLLWRNVPTTTTLIGNKRKTVLGGDVPDEKRVMMDGMKTIGGRESGSFQGGEGTGEAVRGGRQEK